MGNLTTVGLVEDDPVTRDNVVRKIEALADFTVSFAAADLSSARAALAAKVPDILLVDLALPDGDGTDLIREQADLEPDLPIMVMSVFGDEARVIRAIEAGARGFLLKSHSVLAIEQSLQELLQGGSPISPAIAKHLIKRLHPSPQANAEESVLSERELEVLRMAAQGYTYQEIARLLEVSVNTVGSYTKRIYVKLAVNSKSQAVFEALRLGIVEKPK